MMIQYVRTHNLNGRFDFDLQFHEDINLVTGKNGAGKTTLLKLVWYAISGNIEHLLSEVYFTSVEIATTDFILHINVSDDDDRLADLTWTIFSDHPNLFGVDEKSGAVEIPLTGLHRERAVRPLMSINRALAGASRSSVFLPTFRRIEGGFSIGDRYRESMHPRRRGGSLIQDAMSELSSQLSMKDHLFVSSISTDDLHELLTEKYAAISERTNVLHQDLAEFILKSIRARDRVGAERLLSEIENRADHITEERDGLLRPFSVLSDIVETLFIDKGVQFGRSISLGDTATAISSDILSAGEKQMLSFLCYNAFSENSVIFVDEPEISLHVDWQRQLFSILKSQGSSNQFIAATHSPFIYAKYADKEVVLDKDRGA